MSKKNNKIILRYDVELDVLKQRVRAGYGADALHGDAVILGCWAGPEDESCQISRGARRRSAKPQKDFARLQQSKSYSHLNQHFNSNKIFYVF